MTIRLRDRVAMTAVLQNTFSVSFENAFVGVWMILFEPVKERRAKVETEVRVIVYDLGFARRRIVDDGKSIRSIAFDMDAFIPIMKRRGARFLFDNSSPRVFTRRLIEMAVDDQSRHREKHLATKKHKRHKGKTLNSFRLRTCAARLGKRRTSPPSKRRVLN